MSEHKFEVDIDEGNSKPQIPWNIELGPEFKVTKKDGKIRIDIDYENFAKGWEKYLDERNDSFINKFEEFNRKLEKHLFGDDTSL